MKSVAVTRSSHLVALMLGLCFASSWNAPALAQSWGQFKQEALAAVDQGNLVEAERYWASALELCIDKGNRDPRFCASVRGLAGVYRNRGKTSEAAALYKRVIPDPATFSPGCDELNECATAYAAFLKEQNDSTAANVLEQRLNGTATSPSSAASTPASSGAQPVTGGAGTPAVPSATTVNAGAGAASSPKQIQDKIQSDLSAWTQNSAAGKLQLRQKKYALAEQSFRKCLASLASMQAADPRILQTFSGLTDALQAQGRIAEADQVHHASLQWIKRYRGAINQDYMTALTRHGKLLRLLNRREQAMAEENRAEKIQYAIANATRDADAFAPIVSQMDVSSASSLIKGTGTMFTDGGAMGSFGSASGGGFGLGGGAGGGFGGGG